MPVYSQPLYRPPSEAGSLIIQATLGCSFNQCTFCSMYKGKAYLERPLEQIFEDIDYAATHWPATSRVFLADGDALALPTEQLRAILEKLSMAFPRLTRISCYATPANILRKSVKELSQLREQKMSLLYLGIESGSDHILKKVTKGAGRRGIQECLEKAYSAGMKISATVILGLGGATHWQEHIDETASLISSAPVTYLSTLQLYLESSVEAEFESRFGEPFRWQDDHAILLEQARLIGNIEPPRPVVFRSNHASNALALAGNLPRDRSRLLAEIDSALNDAGRLRPHPLRGL